MTSPKKNGKPRSRIEDELKQLRKEVKRLRNAAELRPPAVVIVPITTLAPEPFDLAGTIPVVVQRIEDEYVATFFDANINASGETQHNAVANLKDIMIALLVRLEQMPPQQLGKMPRQQLAILRGLIRRKQPHAIH